MNYSVIIKKKCFPNMCVDYCKQIFIKDKSIHNHREETKSVVVKKNIFEKLRQIKNKFIFNSI